MLAIAGGAALVIGLLAALLLASDEGALAWTDFSAFYGAICFPVVVVLLAVAALWEKRPLPRAGLWLAAAACIAVGSFIVTAGMAAQPGASLFGTFLPYVFFCLPLALVFALPGMYFMAKGLPQVRAALSVEHAAQALQMIEARGEVALNDLAAEVGLPLSACGDLVERLLREGRFAGVFDAASARVYTLTAIAAKQQRLLGAVTTRGQVSIDELARELNTPRALLRRWIYDLVGRGEFTGYMNWDEGRLYSADASKLAHDRCPRCGGELALAGRGVAQCAHCGSEIFVSDPLAEWAAALHSNLQARARYEQLDIPGKRLLEEWVVGATRPDTRAARIQSALRILAANENLRSAFAVPFLRELAFLYGMPAESKQLSPEALALAQAERRALYAYTPTADQRRSGSHVYFRSEPEPAHSADVLVFPPPFEATPEVVKWLGYNAWELGLGMRLALADLVNEHHRFPY
jgi:DNA-binding Lrp family transcriptional regulator